MPFRLKTPQAFTLLEVMVSMVLITLVSASGWLTISVLNKSAQANQLRLRAENLLIYSQEEVYSYSQIPNQYDNLERCTFVVGNSCGFTDITAQFPGVSRFLSFPSVSPNLKQAAFKITWVESGNPEELDASALYTPPEALPGDISGIIHDPKGAIVGGVTVIVKQVGGTANATTTSASTIANVSNNNPVNYTFIDQVSQQYTLSPGTWTLTATKSGYAPYTISNIVVAPGSVTTESFTMDPVPANAYITVSLVDANSGAPITFNSNSQIYLYQNGVAQQSVSSVSSKTFTIPFTNTQQQCFTVATRNAWRSGTQGYAGEFVCSTGNESFNLQADGWSSAASATAGPSCTTQNWAGTGTSGAAPDTICVNPGDMISKNVPLVLVPWATIAGPITDSSSNPVPNEQVTINVYWHNGQLYSTHSFSGTSYSISAPPEQSLFPDIPTYYAILTDTYSVSQLQCCNQNNVVTNSNRYTDAPLTVGQTIQQPLTISTSPDAPKTCGNASGGVIDDSTHAFIPGAAVNLTTTSGLNQTTDGSGNYLFQCPSTETGYLVPIGGATLAATQTGYYAFSSRGNQFYNPVSVSPVLADINNVLPTSVTPTINLWPQQYGTIIVNVEDQGTHAPIPGITVKITPDSAALWANPASPLVTDGSGSVTIDSVPVTWPPLALAGNPKYNQTPMAYTVSTVASALYGASAGYRVATLDANGEQTVTILLDRQGGL